MYKDLGKLFALIFVLGLFGNSAYAQSIGQSSYATPSDFSMELGAGIPVPMTPSNDIGLGDALKGELGLRYLPLYSKWGVRAYYSYASLSDSGTGSSNHSNNLSVHRGELQGIYMLDNLLGIPYRSIFEMESYLGLGLALGKPSSTSSLNKMLSATIGLRPRVLIDNNRLHLYFDASYAALFNQHYDYAGEYIPEVKRGNTEFMLQFSLGLNYRL